MPRVRLPRGVGVNTGAMPPGVGVRLPGDCYPPPAPGLTERAWQDHVYGFARLHGWRVVWFRPARVVRGGKETYETPVGGDGKGWPDCVFVKPGRPVIYAEMKTDTGAVRPEQAEWLSILQCTPSQVFLWRPRDWDSVVKVLTGDK